ncbi:ATP-dependent chaperone protein ClpB [Escherichia coli]|uniref:ATP-dependent chaperone protein ClpB n=1 Tax=Escherichia coli TaxID=562 RepID=A0A376L1K2_ECOLX|nr:ATP-dependent chaperone protein ClpB [Escherichia coli]
MPNRLMKLAANSRKRPLKQFPRYNVWHISTAELDALHNDRLLVSPHVDKKQIAAVIAEWTACRLTACPQNEMSVITDLPKWLGDTIKGQDLAIASLHKHLLTARADLRRPDARWARSCWLGPSGVGKTETVLQLGRAALRRSPVPDHHQYVRVPGETYRLATDWLPSGLRWLR